MITAEKVKNYIKEIISPYLASDITTDFHSEFYYNPDAIANFTIKLLTGNIQAKITQQPIQLICEVDNQYVQDIIDALNEMAINYNETITNIDGVSLRQFYSTPVVIGTFKNDGLEIKSTISMDVNFLTFSNLLDIESLRINNEEIAFLNTAITYTANVNSTGAIGSGIVKQLALSNGNTFSISALLKNSGVLKEILIDRMLLCSNMNQKYKLSIKMGTNKIEIPCILVTGAVNKEINGFPLIELSFMRGDF